MKKAEATLRAQEFLDSWDRSERKELLKILEAATTRPMSQADYEKARHVLDTLVELRESLMDP